MPILTKTAKFHVYDIYTPTSNTSIRLAPRPQFIIGPDRRVTPSEVLCVAHGDYEVCLDENILKRIDQDIASAAGVRAPYINRVSKSVHQKSRVSDPIGSVYSRAAIFLKIIQAMRGKSGLSSSVIICLVNKLNNDEIPQFVSDETAGQDLVDFLSNETDLSLTEDEAISIRLSTFYLTGVASVVCAAMNNIAMVIDPIAALSAEYYGVNIDSFDPVLFELNRQHRGQIAAAANLRMLLEGSKRVNTSPLGPISQSLKHSLTFKTISQVHGSLQEQLKAISK